MVVGTDVLTKPQLGIVAIQTHVDSIDHVEVHRSTPRGDWRIHWGRGSRISQNLFDTGFKTFNKSLESMPSLAERFPHLGGVDDNAANPTENADNEEELYKDAGVCFCKWLLLFAGEN